MVLPYLRAFPKKESSEERYISSEKGEVILSFLNCLVLDGSLLHSQTFICLFLSHLSWTDTATNSCLNETFFPKFHMHNSFNPLFWPK